MQIGDISGEQCIHLGAQDQHLGGRDAPGMQLASPKQAVIRRFRHSKAIRRFLLRHKLAVRAIRGLPLDRGPTVLARVNGHNAATSLLTSIHTMPVLTACQEVTIGMGHESPFYLIRAHIACAWRPNIGTRPASQSLQQFRERCFEGRGDLAEGSQSWLACTALQV